MVNQKTVIDAHCHIYPDMLAEKAANGAQPQRKLSAGYRLSKKEDARRRLPLACFKTRIGGADARGAKSNWP